MDSENSYYARIAIVQEAECTGFEMRRPSVLFKANLHCPNGGDWEATYGSFIAYGSTPDEAMRNFDKHWSEK